MLANGYSRAIGAGPQVPGASVLPGGFQDALSLIQEKLSFYKTGPLKGDWFCVLIDGYRAKLRTDDGKLKEILGFWIFPRKETKKAWAEVFQDLVNRG